MEIDITLECCNIKTLLKRKDAKGAMTQRVEDKLSYKIIGAAIEVKVTELEHALYKTL